MDLQGLASWSFGVLKVFEVVFGCCKYYSIFIFLFNVCLMQKYVI